MQCGYIFLFNNSERATDPAPWRLSVPSQQDRRSSRARSASELRLEKECARMVYLTQPCPGSPSITRVAAAACAEGWPPFPRQPGAPVPAAGPPSRQRGAGLHGPFGHFRRALGSVRVRGGSGAPGRVRAELAGPSPVRARRRLSPRPPLPHAPPLPPLRELASSAAEAAEIGICSPAARRRRAEGREEGGRVGGSSSRARRGPHGRARGDRARAAARRGRRPSRAPPPRGCPCPPAPSAGG